MFKKHVLQRSKVQAKQQIYCCSNVELLFYVLLFSMRFAGFTRSLSLLQVTKLQHAVVLLERK